MLNRRRKRFWQRWGPAIVVCIFCAAFPIAVWRASYQPPPHHNHGPAHADNQNEPAGNRSAIKSANNYQPERQDNSHWYDILWEHPTDWLLVFFNGILAAFTARLFYATAGLVAAADDQSKKMAASIKENARSADAMASVATSMLENVERLKETVATNKEIARRQKIFGEMQLRAYISVLVGDFYMQDRGKNASLQFHPKMFNGGNTPARNVNFRGKVIVAPYPPNDDFDYALPAIADERAVTGLGARGDATMSFFADRWYSDEEVSAIREASTVRAYVIGTITYDDMFESAHRTNFCFCVKWNLAGQPIAEWTRRHNDFD